MPNRCAMWQMGSMRTAYTALMSACCPARVQLAWKKALPTETQTCEQPKSRENSQ